MLACSQAATRGERKKTWRGEATRTGLLFPPLFISGPASIALRPIFPHRLANDTRARKRTCIVYGSPRNTRAILILILNTRLILLSLVATPTRHAVPRRRYKSHRVNSSEEFRTTTNSCYYIFQNLWIIFLLNLNAKILYTFDTEHFTMLTITFSLKMADLVK